MHNEYLFLFNSMFFHIITHCILYLIHLITSNMTNDLTGVQIGLINMAKTGFLPIFPFFNIDGRIFVRNMLLLKTNMGTGHGGPSGRYDYLKEIAFEYAFVFDLLGMNE